MRNSLKLALLLPLFALMAPTGGFPSRPIFQQVTVNSTAGTVALALNSPAAVNFSRMDYRLGGTTQAITGTAGAANDIITGAAQNDFNVRTASGAIRFSNDNGATSTYSVLRNGGNSAGTLFAPTGKFAQTVVESNATSAEAGICVSDTAALCAASDAANDTSIFGTGVIHIQNTSGTDYLTISSTTITQGAGITTVPWAPKPIAVVLASDSVKTSNVTQALDATLQLTIPGAGTYMVELNGAILPAGIAAAAGGFAGCLQYSGTIAVLSAGTYSAALYVTNVAFSNQWLVEQTITTSCTGGSQVIYTSQTVGGTFDQLAWRGVLTTSTGGTFGLSWAQSSSSATPTTLKQGMVLSATRIL